MKTPTAPHATGLSAVDLVQIRRHLHAMKQEIASLTGSRVAMRRDQIETALRRMDRGGFGSCLACTHPVGRHRLLATPYVRYCASCL